MEAVLEVKLKVDEVTEFEKVITISDSDAEIIRSAITAAADKAVALLIEKAKECCT